jgi:hypothetical protein
VSRQPLLLVANVDELLDELARYVCVCIWGLGVASSGQQ